MCLLNQSDISLLYVTFHEQLECGYGFPLLALATHASAGESECFLSTRGNKPLWNDFLGKLFCP